MSLEGNHVIFCLGGPGAGKGTQCANVSKNFPVTHLSAGELLRQEMARPGSEHGELIDTLIKEGKIVPAEITVSLLLKAIKEDKHSFFLIDGFPRNEENRSAWFKLADDTGLDTAACICIDVSQAEMRKRIMGRSVDSGRTDDNDVSLRKRFDTFNNETSVVLKWFESVGKLKRINGEGSIEDIFQDMSAFFTELMDKYKQ